MSEQNVFEIDSQQTMVPDSSKKSRCLNMSKREKCLLVGVAILVAVFIVSAMAIVYLSWWKNPKPVELQNVCSSDKCVSSAYNILKSIDRTVDPCEDFYRFACGNWHKNHPVKASFVLNHWHIELANDIVQRITESLENVSVEDDPKAVKQLKSFYKSCTDIDTVEKVGLNAIVQVLQDLKLPVGIPTNETTSRFKLAQTLARIKREMNKDMFLSYKQYNYEGEDYLVITPPGILDPSSSLDSTLEIHSEQVPKISNLSKRKWIEWDRIYIVGLLKIMDSFANSENGTKIDEEEIESISTEIIQFRENLTLITPKTLAEIINSSDDNLTMITIQQLQEITDATSEGASDENKIDWGNYFSDLWMGIENRFTNNTDKMIVLSMEYFEDLAALLADTDTEVIQRFIWLEVVSSLASYTNKAMRKLEEKLRHRVYVASDPVPRTTYCVQTLRKLLPLPIAYTQAIREDLTTITSKVSAMMEDIRNSFKSLVKSSNWLDPETKKAVLDKVDAIIVYIAYPDWLLEPGKLDEYYNWLEIADNKFLVNILKIKHHDSVQTLSKNYITASSRNVSWMGDPLKVNARYNANENVIDILAGVLQFPFFGLGLESLNYGAIGFILGHELTHGFDNTGKNFGKNGSKISWWKPETLQAYEDKAQCFVKQYSSYEVDGHQVNGNLTLGENIADNGAIREVYTAYQRYKENHDAEPALPGLEEFTQDQLLFLAFANSWCISEGKGYGKFTAVDVHSPQRLRVLGPLSNLEEFSKTWNCPVNASMNPPHRCIVW